VGRNRKPTFQRFHSEHFSLYIILLSVLPEKCKQEIQNSLIVYRPEHHFTTRRCCRDLLEPRGSFSKAGTGSIAFFTLTGVCGSLFFLNCSLILLTLNPSISIIFIMERGLLVKIYSRFPFPEARDGRVCATPFSGQPKSARLLRIQISS
jgi:hypothetical protein